MVYGARLWAYGHSVSSPIISQIAWSSVRERPGARAAVNAPSPDRSRPSRAAQLGPFRPGLAGLHSGAHHADDPGRYQFETIHLWEHAGRIRSGELRELAPLLVLCENSPTEATLREERELILGWPGPAAVRNELLAIAVMVGTRYFARERLVALFREEMAMLKEASVIQEWIEEGEARGRAEEARRVALRLLEAQFGELPAAVVERVHGAEAEWCEEVAVRVLRARSLPELGL